MALLDAVATPLEGVENDRDATEVAHPLDGLGERSAALGPGLDADGEQVAVDGRDLNAGDAEQAVLGGELGRPERFLDRVVIGDHDPVEVDLGHVFEEEFDRLPAVVRVLGVDVRVDGDRGRLGH